MSPVLRIKPEDTGSPTEKAKLFKDSVFLKMLSNYTIKSFLLGVLFFVVASSVVFLTWKEELWLPAGIIGTALGLGAAFASFKDFLSRVKTFQVNSALIPSSANNHFIKWFAGKR